MQEKYILVAFYMLLLQGSARSDEKKIIIDNFFIYSHIDNTQNQNPNYYRLSGKLKYCRLTRSYEYL